MDSNLIINIFSNHSNLITLKKLNRLKAYKENLQKIMNSFKKTILFLLFCSLTLAQWLPKIVWTFWNKPLEQQNDLLKALHKNHVDMLKDGGWELRHMNYQNFWNWADKIPKLKQAYEHPFWKQLATAQKVDLIRLAILSYYGGLYIDMSIILTQNLDWLLNLKQHPQVQNKYGQQPNIFYTFARHGNKQRYLDIETGQKFVMIPAVEVFFLACKPNNTFMIQWLNFAIDQKIENYQKYKYTSKSSIFLDIAKEEKIDVGGFSQRYFQMSVAAIILLARKQRQLDQTWNYDPLKPRPLIVKNLKLWTTDSDKNAYLYFNFEQGFVKSFISVDTQRYKKEANGVFTPFVKFWHEIYVKLLQFLTSTEELDCKKDLFLLQSSIVYQYLLKQYPTHFYTAKVYDNSTYHRECTIEGQVTKIEKQFSKLQVEIEQLDNPIEELNSKMKEFDKQNFQENKQILNVKEIRKQIEEQLTKMKKQNQNLNDLDEQGQHKLPLAYRLKLKIDEYQTQKTQNSQKNKDLELLIDQLNIENVQKNKQLQNLNQMLEESSKKLSQAKNYKSKIHIFGTIIIIMLIFLNFAILTLFVKVGISKKNNKNRKRKIFQEIAEISLDEKSFIDKINENI